MSVAGTCVLGFRRQGREITRGRAAAPPADLTFVNPADDPRKK
jgi:hypothetical protein